MLIELLSNTLVSLPKLWPSQYVLISPSALPHVPPAINSYSPSPTQADISGVINLLVFKQQFMFRTWYEELILILNGTAGMTSIPHFSGMDSHFTQGPIKDLAACPKSRGEDTRVDKYNLIAFATTQCMPCVFHENHFL
jgi:hypothetical protein